MSKSSNGRGRDREVSCYFDSNFTLVCWEQRISKFITVAFDPTRISRVLPCSFNWVHGVERSCTIGPNSLEERKGRGDCHDDDRWSSRWCTQGQSGSPQEEHDDCWCQKFQPKVDLGILEQAFVGVGCSTTSLRNGFVVVSDQKY